jgi:hypothetical protein
VFVSHSSADTWVAKQIAREIEACGATPFLDEAQVSDCGAPARNHTGGPAIEARSAGAAEEARPAFTERNRRVP